MVLLQLNAGDLLRKNCVHFSFYRRDTHSRLGQQSWSFQLFHASTYLATLSICLNSMFSTQLHVEFSAFSFSMCMHLLICSSTPNSVTVKKAIKFTRNSTKAPVTYFALMAWFFEYLTWFLGYWAFLRLATSENWPFQGLKGLISLLPASQRPNIPKNLVRQLKKLRQNKQSI